MSLTLNAEQRDAIYELVSAELTGLGDLLRAVEEHDLERAYRLGRLYGDCLRLIVDGLGWGRTGIGPVEIAIPAEDLRPILGRLRDRAAAVYDRERPDQEESRAMWERTALVRDTCDALMPHMST